MTENDHNLEIVERSSGFWIVDGQGNSEGPFLELEEAYESLNKMGVE
jgi:hypothetical protein